MEPAPTVAHTLRLTRGSAEVSSERRAWPRATHIPDRLESRRTRSPAWASAVPATAPETSSSPSSSSTTAASAPISDRARRTTRCMTASSSSPEAMISFCAAMIARSRSDSLKPIPVRSSAAAAVGAPAGDQHLGGALMQCPGMSLVAGGAPGCADGSGRGDLHRHSRGGGLGAGEVGVRQQNRELAVADPEGLVGEPGPAQQLGDLAQHVLDRGLPTLLGDGAEAVELDQDERERIAIASRALSLDGEALLIGGTIGQLGVHPL